jgi:hypothetical protein
MSKHTPGPWRWGEFSDRRFYVSQEDGAPYTPHYSDVATLIAETVSDERRSIQRANARLIAAAPCLLEALKDVLARIQNSGEWWMDEPTRGGFDVEKICAAIAKATGENQ